jgi:hypothetical protein
MFDMYACSIWSLPAWCIGIMVLQALAQSVHCFTHAAQGKPVFQPPCVGPPPLLQTVAAPCDVATAQPVNFLAGSSTDPSGRPLTRYVWRQQQVNPVLGEVIAAVNARNNGR